MNSILYVSPFASAVSGADESLLTIVTRLPSDQFTPVVALPFRSPYAERFRRAGARVFSLPLLRLKRTLNPFYWFAYLLWQAVEVTLFVILIVRTKAALVHVNMESTLSAAIAGRVLGKPVILHYRGKTRENPTLFFDIFLPFLCRISDHVFVISGAVAVFFEKRGLRARVEVLHNAVDLTRFREPGPRDYFKRRGEPFENRRVVTFLGRFDPQKRIADLIEAAQILAGKKVAFAVIGGDPAVPEEMAHRRVLEADLRSRNPVPPVYFLGREKDVPYVLRSTDLLVLPSIDEGFGRVLVEAMAAGTPVIAAESGASPEILEKGRYGRLVPPCRPNLLAAAIEETLEDPQRRTKTEAAQIYACDHFDIAKHVARLLEVYRELLGTR